MSISSASMRADPRPVAAGDDPVQLRHALGLGRAGDPAAGGGADRVVAAGMVGMPVGVPDLGDRPAARGRRLQHRLGDRGIDRDRLARSRDRGPARHNCRAAPGRGRSRAWPPVTALPPSSASASRPSRSVSARAGSAPAEARRLAGPHRPEAERRERDLASGKGGASARIGAEPLGEPARQAAGEAAAVEIGEAAMLGRLARQAFAVRRRDEAFRAMEIGGADLHRRRAERSAPPRCRARRRSRRPRSPAGRSRPPPAAPGRRGPSAPRAASPRKRPAWPPASQPWAMIASTPRVGEPARLGDRRRIAEDRARRSPGPVSSRAGSGRPKWKLTSSGRTCFDDRAHRRVERLPRRRGRLRARRCRLRVKRPQQRPPGAVVHRLGHRRGRRS